MRDFQRPGRSAVFATEGMCATSHPLASTTAVDILRRGGSAADAAIAGAVLLGLCEPQMTGIGGDAFVLVSPGPGAPIEALNASGRAPAGFDAPALRDAGHSEIPVESAQAVTIPTAVDGFAKLHTRHGALPWADLMAPAIHYAEAGVPVAPRVASDWANSQDRLQGAGRDYFLLGGSGPRAGQIFRAPAQAKALKLLADQGRDGFYTGAVAADMVQALAALGGSHTEADFAEAAADWTDPIRGGFENVTVVEHPPNGQGTAALLLLDILSKVDLAGCDPLGPDRVHLEAEATKLAYDARNRFVAEPGAMVDPTYLQRAGLADRLAGLIDPKRAMADPAPITEAVHRDTVYITVVDRNRMAVSLIYSIFHSFGSGITSPDFGILLHNRGAGFTLAEGHPNEAAPGKRPMHTILPGMVERDGALDMSFGVMGGQYQSTGHARFLSNIETFGMDPQMAIDAPRAFAEAGELRLETGYGDAVRADLTARGHTVVTPDEAIGGAQAIRLRSDGVLEGASDPRKDGCALGY